MDSRFEPKLYIKLDKDCLEPSEQINGFIIVESHQPFLANELRLLLKCEEKVNYFQKITNPDYSRLTEEEKRDTSVPQYIHKNYKNQNTFYSTFQTIANYGLQAVAAGIYQYPFSFKLQNCSPNSFEYLWKTDQYQNEASISYTLTARMLKDGDTRSCQDSIKYFYIQKTPTGLEIENKRVIDYHRVFNWCCLEKGVIMLATYFEKDWYHKDEDVFMVCEIDNSESNLKINYVSCQLDQSLSLKADRAKHVKLRSQVDGEKLEINLEPGKKMTGTNAIRLKIPLAGRKPEAKIQSTVNSDIIQCQHDITVLLTLAGCCESRPSNFLHITLFDRPASNNVFEQTFGPPTKIYNPVVFNPVMNMAGTIPLDKGTSYPSFSTES